MNLDWGCAGASSQQVMLSLGDEINMNDMNMPIQWQEGSSESVITQQTRINLDFSECFFPQLKKK